MDDRKFNEVIDDPRNRDLFAELFGDEITIDELIADEVEKTVYRRNAKEIYKRRELIKIDDLSEFRKQLIDKGYLNIDDLIITDAVYEPIMINGEYYLRRKYGDDKAMENKMRGDEAMENILDEYIKTVEFRNWIVMEAKICVEFYSEADFYNNLEQMLLERLDINNVKITDKVIEFVDEYIMDKDYFVDYIPEQIIEIWANEQGGDWLYAKDIINNVFHKCICEFAQLGENKCIKV